MWVLWLLFGASIPLLFIPVLYVRVAAVIVAGTVLLVITQSL